MKFESLSPSILLLVLEYLPLKSIHTLLQLSRTSNRLVGEASRNIRRIHQLLSKREIYSHRMYPYACTLQAFAFTISPKLSEYQIQEAFYTRLLRLDELLEYYLNSEDPFRNLEDIHLVLFEKLECRYDQLIELAVMNGYTRLLIKLLSANVELDYPKALLIACEFGFYATVNYFLPHRYFDLTDECLIKSVTNNHVGIVDVLLEFCDPAVDGQFAIRLACKLGYHQILRILLRDKRVDPSIHFNTCIKQATYGGHVACVELLLKDERVDPTVQSNYALRYACRFGFKSIVKLLLEDGRVNPADDEQYAICACCANGFLDILHMLIQDSRVNPDYNGIPLLRACECSHKEIVQYLVQDTRVRVREVHLMTACVTGSVDVFNLLMRKSLVLPSSHCLLEAVHFGHFPIVKILLRDYGLNPSIECNSAVIVASQKGYSEIFSVLLGDKRIDPSVYNNTPLKNAIRNGYFEIVKMLVEDDRVDPFFDTQEAIICAARKGYLDIIMLLRNDARFVDELKSHYEIRSILLKI